MSQTREDILKKLIPKLNAEEQKMLKEDPKINKRAYKIIRKIIVASGCEGPRRIVETNYYFVRLLHLFPTAYQHFVNEQKRKQQLVWKN